MDGVGIEQVGAPFDGTGHQPVGEAERIGIGRARRQKGGFAVDTELSAERPVVEEMAGKPGPHPQLMLLHQRVGVRRARREIEGVPRAHPAGDLTLFDERLQAVHRLQAQSVDAGGPLETVEVGEAGERTVDFPQQHRGACRRAPQPRPLAIDNADVAAFADQPLRHQRPVMPAPTTRTSHRLSCSSDRRGGRLPIAHGARPVRRSLCCAPSMESIGGCNGSAGYKLRFAAKAAAHLLEQL